LKAIRSSFLLAGFFAICVAPLGNSQDVVKHRLGRPVDWSHTHLVASRGGPDKGLSIYGDWRTIFRHLEIEQIETAREVARKTLSKANRSERNWAQATWLFVGLLAFAFVGAKGENKRKWAVYLALFVFLPVSIIVGCGGGGSEIAAAGASTSDVKLDWSINTGSAASVTAFPAKFNFDITASHCNDVIYFTAPEAGGPSTVNVIGVTNPYATCPGNLTGLTPTIKFGIALPFSATNSSVLSLDGKVLYLIESRPAASVMDLPRIAAPPTEA